jgi:hypothetical protein
LRTHDFYQLTINIFHSFRRFRLELGRPEPEHDGGRDEGEDRVQEEEGPKEGQEPRLQKEIRNHSDPLESKLFVLIESQN